MKLLHNKSGQLTGVPAQIIVLVVLAILLTIGVAITAGMQTNLSFVTNTATQNGNNFSSRSVTLSAPYCLGISQIANGTYYLNLSNNLVGYYPLDAGANDFSGLGNNGVVSDAVATTSGYFENAYTFDGVSGTSINITKTETLNTSYRSFSVSAWVYANTIGTNDDSYIVANSGVAEGSAGWHLMLLNAQPTININNGSSNSIAATKDIPFNQWVLVTATYELNGNATIYVNGVKNNTAEVGVGAEYSTKPITFGKWYSSNETYFDGTIDEVRIYNTSLTAAQVAGLYTMTNPRRTTTWDLITYNATITDNARCAMYATLPNGVLYNVTYTWRTLDTAYNATGSGVTSLDGFADWIPTIGIVLAASIVVGLVMSYLAFKQKD